MERPPIVIERSDSLLRPVLTLSIKGKKKKEVIHKFRVRNCETDFC